MQVEWSTFRLLTEENVNAYVPRDAGLYLLWVKLKNDKWRCYYVGQADDLERRLLQHLSPDEENKCIKDNAQNYISGYEYARITRQGDRDGVEKFLYDHCKPECNVVNPSGTPIPVNLP